MTRAVPAPVKVDDQWYLVFGSGPTDYDGTSAQSSYLYVADMKTGDLLKKFGPYESNAFFSTAAAFDKNLNYNVDGIYIGNSNWTQPSNTSSQDVAQDDGWQGSVYKIAVPCTNCQWQADYKSSQDYGYDIDPANWYAHKLFSSNRPITAPPTVSVEAYPDFDVDNVWIYFGTGRHLAGTDKSTSDEQYIYGIKDPYFNKQLYENNGMHDYSQAQLITIDHQGSPLFESDLITVTTGGHVLQSGSLYGSSGSFDELVDDIRNNYDGWLRPLETNATSPSERMISKPSVFAGLTFFPVFTPEEDICGLGGSSNLYGLYYLTGTGYTKQIFQVQTPIIDSTTGEKVVEVKMPDSMVGSPPPSLGIHTGSESGGKVYMQQSTGEIVEIDIGAALYFKSTITDWWDR
ncbi:MAG: hypothetical protein GY874_14965, partial [Desulfobacteraceae bacterium]|nr:hypothetical protein [Desulfobacteraceae bacterium]